MRISDWSSDVCSSDLASQAPGVRVHETGIPWNDASGRRLRQWLDVDDATFYNPTKVAIVPMGFCYPGKAGSGDAPPRPECRATWHPRLLPLLPGIRLTLLVGQYAQAYFLGKRRKASLPDPVHSWRAYMPPLLPMPPPSPTKRGVFRAKPWSVGAGVPSPR